MKLQQRIIIPLSIVQLLLFAVWATLFYYIIIDEINDETDDSLEYYSEYIITRALEGEELPDKNNGTNNSYHLVEVTPEYASQTPSVRFSDEVVYIHSEKETEPSRVLRTVFKDRYEQYFELTVMIPTIEKEDLKETILHWIVLLYFVLLLAIIVINLLIHRHSLQPLYTMLSWLENVTPAKKAPPLNTYTRVSEFRKLSDALQRSAQRGNELYEQQRLLIGHASHELQTPVAIAQNQLELLADDPALTESQLEQILKAKQSLEKLSKLNKTLLLLTKIDSEQFPDSIEIDVNKMLASLLADFEEAYKHLNINCVMEQEAHIGIRANEMLTHVLFSNLFKNAYLHNRPDGSIRIAVSLNGVRVSNTAIHGALNPAYIFRRFYREAPKEGSSGLGLSLVDSICKYYGMQVSYTFEDEMHHFDIHIPQSLKNF